MIPKSKPKLRPFFPNLDFVDEKMGNSLLDLSVERRKDVEDYFWSNLIRTEDGCWGWKGWKTNGYAGLKVFYKKYLGHRVSYELFKGRIPEGKEIDHLCRNRICVNPNHLEVVTTKENVLRGNNFIAINARKTHCHKGHPLEGDNLMPWGLKKGKRVCRICKQEGSRRLWQLRKQRAQSLTCELLSY